MCNRNLKNCMKLVSEHAKKRRKYREIASPHVFPALI